MAETWVLWVFLVGLAIGAVTTFVLMVRLPRRESDVAAAERPTEAAWISAIIERDGGIAPPLLVEEVLDLHHAYLAEPRPPAPPAGGPWPTVPTPYAGPPAGLPRPPGPAMSMPPPMGPPTPLPPPPDPQSR